MDQGYNVSHIEAKFKDFLRAENISADTLKNYLSDMRHFSGWLLHKNLSLIDIVDKVIVEEYKSYLIQNNVPSVTVNRRLSSLRKFFDFLHVESIIHSNPARLVPNIHKIQAKDKINEIKQSIEIKQKIVEEPEKPFLLRNFISSIIHSKKILTGVIIFIILSTSSTVLVKKFSKKSSLALQKNTQQKRGRILTFRGKLLDSLGNPISSKTDTTFNIYTKETEGSPIYTGSCKGVSGLTPEFDGFASVVIGKDCAMEPIPQSVFAENPGLYLGVTIGSDKELKPRQQIANVSYALDSERLQGLEIGNGPNSIPYIDENSSINFEASESSIKSIGADGLFSIISDGSVSLESGDQGDIILTSGLSGSLKFKTGGFTDSISNLFIGTDGNVGIGSETPSNFKLQVAGDVGPEADDTFNLGSEDNQWANVYSSKFLQNGVALCDEQGNNCPTNISSWTLSSPYLYTNEKNIKVGIGTSTPLARLDVSGGQTKIELSTQYTERLCHSGLDSSSTQNALLGDCSSGGADMAEYYGSHDRTIEPGDVVIAASGASMVGKDSKGYAEKSNKAYDSRIVGIVSTNPYDSFGKNFSPDEHSFPVALSGRVPVKISRKSDPIKAGDLITSSDENGRAMKATHAGQIIGKALEDWSPDSNKDSLLVFVNTSWSDPGLMVSSSGGLLSAEKSSTYVYNGIIKNEDNQISLLNSIIDISYSMAQNSLHNTAIRIQNLLVSEKVVSPIIETTDLIASGSSRLSQLHTNSIKTDGNSIEIDLEEDGVGPLAELIIKGANGRRAASIDAQGNATFSGQLNAESLSSNSISTNNLNSTDASISGTLVAKEIESDTIKALEQRINSLADSSRQNPQLLASSSANIRSATNSATIGSNSDSEIQGLIAKLKDAAIADPQYYHVPDMENLDFEDLTVTGKANFYKLNVAQSMTVGNMIIENDTILSLADNLNITALSTISLFDGAITIAKDGTMTTKGAIIAQGGIKTNTIETIDKNVVVKLAHDVIDGVKENSDDNSKLIIANANGAEVASIDASGSAQFDEISVSKYMDATDSANLISAADNLEQRGLFAPAFDAEKKVAGLGLLPQNATEVVIYTEKIKPGSLVYLTPTEQISDGQLSILEKEACTENADTSSACHPYFRVGISKAEHAQLSFNWLIIN